MYDFIMAENSELMNVILHDPHVPMRELKEEEVTRLVPKNRREYNEDDCKKIEKNYNAKKLLVPGIGLDEYNRVSECEPAKDIWDCLRTNHEGTSQVKESKVDMLTISRKSSP